MQCGSGWRWWRLLGAFAAASVPLTVGSVALGVASGLTLPAFMVSTGLLVNALKSNDSTVVPLAAVVVSFVLARAADPVREAISHALWKRVDHWLTQRLMTALIRPPGLSHMEEPEVQDAIAQARGALIERSPGEAAYFLAQVISTGVQGLSALVIVATFHWYLAAVLLASYGLAFRVARRHWDDMTMVVHGRTEAMRRAYYLRELALSSTAAKETRVFGLATWLVAQYRQHWLSVMRQVWRVRNERWGVSIVATVAVGAVELLAFTMVARAAVGGRLTLGHALVVLQAILAGAMLSRYQEEHWLQIECLRAIDSVGRVEAVARTSAGSLDLAEQPEAVDGRPRATIRLESLRFAYPGRPEPVFDGLDLEIPAGRSLAIVGENGAGKTTLVKLLCRFYDPQAGRILVDEADVRRFAAQEWHRRVAAIFQDYVQFGLSAYDNIALGALHRRDDRDLVMQAAQLAGADEFIERLPRGWDTVLSNEFTKGTQLSGGQWQRLALARALFAVRAGAGVLILDEPTAALDVRGEADVYERFLELTKGTTTIVISHRFSTVRRADSIAVLEHGKVVERGTHDELIADGGLYAQMYDLQSSRFSTKASHE